MKPDNFLTMSHNRKLFLFIAMSVDGYIARQDDNIDFLSMVEKQGEDYGYSKFIESVDTVILGRRTYDKIVSMSRQLPYGNREVFVWTRSVRPDEGKVHFYSGKVDDLISSLRSREGMNIYCDGGAEVIHSLLMNDLIDEMIISIIPILLGDGISLFKGGLEEKKLSLQSVASYEKGLVQMHFVRDRDS